MLARLLPQPQGFLAQLTPDSLPMGEQIREGIGLDLNNLRGLLVQVVTAVALLILGWIVALILAKVTQTLLKRLQFDTRLAQFLGSDNEAVRRISITGIVSGLVFWVIFLVAVVMFLDALRLTTASQPLNTFLNQVFSFLPKLGAAIILGAVAWLVATFAKLVAIRSAQTLNLDRPLQQLTAEEAAPPPILFSDMLGNTLYWFILLFFLPLILGVLELQGALQPVQNLLNDILAALPFVLKAVIIGIVGWLIAQIVRRLVVNLMTAFGVQRLGQRLGLGQVSLGESLATGAGTLVYVLILIPTAIAALEALQIAAISEPATAMLNQVLLALPRIFTAGVILVLSYVIGRFVAETLQGFLGSLGFDQVFVWLGLPLPPAAAEQATETQRQWRQPSEIVGIVVLVGIVLVGAIAAVEVLEISALTAFVTALLVILGQVLVGIVIFAVGLYLANWAFRLVAAMGGSQARFLAQAARMAILAFVGAMALQQMGIAASIVNLAFGLLFGSIAVAIALAFGLGCQAIAADQVKEWIGLLKGKNTDPQ
ncbi:MAG: mechanosensitive ion channel [Thermosynechococcus sp.]|uniref:mechanosensitive ion channel n=1 Tax=Thermosynechococcus sp. TaxID=2814275 RepID=UPI00391D564C